MSKLVFSWSWKRATGISALRGKIAKATGIPTTKAGRQRKVGRLLGAAGWALLAGGDRKPTPQPAVMEVRRIPEQEVRHEMWIGYFVRTVFGVCFGLAGLASLAAAAVAYFSADPHTFTVEVFCYLLGAVVGVRWAFRWCRRRGAK